MTTRALDVPIALDEENRLHLVAEELEAESRLLGIGRRLRHQEQGHAESEQAHEGVLLQAGRIRQFTVRSLASRYVIDPSI